MSTGSVAALKGFNLKSVGLVVAIVLVVCSFFIPETETLSRNGITSLALLLGAIALWCCSTFPIGVTGLLTIVLAVSFGVVEASKAFSGFASTTFIYVIGIFAMPAILLKTNWGMRLVNSLFKLTGPSSSKLVLVFMIATALVSTIMTDTPAIVVMLGPAYVVLRAIDAKPGESRLGKALLIALPVASIIGGIATPAGSTSNVAAMGLLQELTGVTIPFLGWAMVGIPLVFVFVPLFWLSIVKTLKPEPLSQKVIDALKNEVIAAGPPTLYEKKALFMLLLIPTLWVVGNWIPLFSITNVAVVGLALMMMPGMNLLTFDEFQKSVPWNVVLMVGSVLSIGAMLTATGGAAFLANMFMSSGILALDFFWIMLISSLFIYAFHTFCPIGPAAIGLFLPILVGVCAQFGASPVVPTILLSFIVAGNFILPINPTLTITYDKGYYSFKDMTKAGIVPTIVSLVIAAIWVPFAVAFAGL